MAIHAHSSCAASCYSCGVINVLPSDACDGRTCLVCGGQLRYLGHAVVATRSTKSTGISIKVCLQGVEPAKTQLQELEEASARIIENLKLATTLLGH